MKKWGPFLLTACLLFSACATLPVLPLRPPAPDELLNQVSKRLQALQGLKGLAQVRVSSPEKSFSTQDVFFVRRPGFLRIESLGPLGTPQFYAVTDGRELNLYYPGENRYYRGQATASHLSSALPVALEPEEVVAFLLGGLPLMDYEIASVRGDRREGLWVLELIANSRRERQSFWVSPQSFQILRAELHRPGSSCRLTFADFRQDKDFFFPQRIQFNSFHPKMQISVEYQEVDLNPDWEAKDFQLPVPQGAAVIPLK